ncbi:MAG TPA: hypothetical protein PK597_06215, partial [Oscillospiraceae bacterium]|nr:hypothetical protein [Oscillospiraceae bacterium]
CFVQFILVWLEFRFLQKPNVQKMGELDIEKLRSTIPPTTKRERNVGIAFIVLIIMWVFPETIMKIPGLYSFGALLKNFGTYAPPLLIVSALCIIPTEGRPLLDLKKAAASINWSIWMMMAALMGMATFLGKSDYGVMPWLTQVVGGFFQNLGVSGTVFCWIAILWVGIQTNFMSNTASCSLYSAFVPIAAVIGGCNPLALGMCIGMISNSGFMVPSANPVMGLCCSLPPVRITYTIKYGIIASLLCIAAVCFVAYPLYSAVLPVVTTLVG